MGVGDENTKARTIVRPPQLRAGAAVAWSRDAWEPLTFAPPSWAPAPPGWPPPCACTPPARPSPSSKPAPAWAAAPGPTEVDGWRIDPAVQLYSSAYTTFRGLLRAAGAEGLLERSPGRDALWRKGRAHEVVYGSPTSMLASGALPLPLKLRMGAKYLPFLQRHGSDLDLAALERAAAAGLDGESIAAWGQRELGRDFVDLLAAPLLATLYGMAPGEASAGFYHALARQGLSLEVQALRGGADGFCRAAAEALRAAGSPVRLSTPVDAVDAAEDGVRVRGDGWSEDFGAAVVARARAGGRTAC